MVVKLESFRLERWNWNSLGHANKTRPDNDTMIQRIASRITTGTKSRKYYYVRREDDPRRVIPTAGYFTAFRNNNILDLTNPLSLFFQY
jgi:hypothetical protein